MDMCGDISTVNKTMTLLILYPLCFARCRTIKQTAGAENGIIKLAGLQPAFRQRFFPYSWMNERNLQTWHESVAAGKKPLMMIMRNAERNAQWRHTLQSGIETARVPLDELTPHAEKLAPLLAQWHQKGLSRDASTCLRLTNEGRFWASNILQSLNELIQVLNAPAIALEKP